MSIYIAKETSAERIAREMMASVRVKEVHELAIKAAKKEGAEKAAELDRLRPACAAVGVDPEAIYEELRKVRIAADVAPSMVAIETLAGLKVIELEGIPDGVGRIFPATGEFRQEGGER